MSATLVIVIATVAVVWVATMILAWSLCAIAADADRRDEPLSPRERRRREAA